MSNKKLREIVFDEEKKKYRFVETGKLIEYPNVVKPVGKPILGVTYRRGEYDIVRNGAKKQKFWEDYVLFDKTIDRVVVSGMGDVGVSAHLYILTMR